MCAGQRRDYHNAKSSCYTLNTSLRPPSQVSFADGLTGLVDMARLLHSPKAGVFAALRDPSLFARVTIEHGVVTWPGELDLAPDAMHDAIRQHGVWAL